jgi:hypothetical protein
LDDFVYPDEFRDYVLAAAFLIHPLDKRRRETVFLAKENSDFFHKCLGVISSEAEKSLDISNISNPAAAGDFARHDTRAIELVSLTPDFSPVIAATRVMKPF